MKTGKALRAAFEKYNPWSLSPMCRPGVLDELEARMKITAFFLNVIKDQRQSEAISEKVVRLESRRGFK